MLPIYIAHEKIKQNRYLNRRTNSYEQHSIASESHKTRERYVYINTACGNISDLENEILKILNGRANNNDVEIGHLELQ